MLKKLAPFLISLTLASPLSAEPLRIFAASDLRYAMDEMIAEFRKKHPDATVEPIYGSSGKAYAQIRSGAPYDLFFSASIDYPESLIREGFGAGESHLYAIGRIVLWVRRGFGVDLRRGLELLRDPSVRKIAIANPEHAPYGIAAREALIKKGVWDEVKRKIVMGENIAQAAHFAASGATDVGIIAYSLALSPEMRSLGEFRLIDATDHAPLRQGFIITKRGAAHPTARSFADFILGPEAKRIFQKYGFVVPEK
jgi:molybdate transport system substrate-binding protein